MTSDAATDTRLDPRLRALPGLLPDNAESDVTSREEMLIEPASPAGLERESSRAKLVQMGGNEEVAPSRGPRSSTREVGPSLALGDRYAHEIPLLENDLRAKRVRS